MAWQSAESYGQSIEQIVDPQRPRRRATTLFRRKTLGDLFFGLYP